MRFNRTKTNIERLLGRAATLLVVGILVFSPLFGLVEKVSAQSVLNTLGQGTIQAGNGTTDAKTIVNSSGTATNGVVGPTPFNSTQSNATTLPTTGSGSGGGSGGEASFCSWSAPSTCISAVIYLFTVGFMSIIAYIGAYLFDMALHLSIQSTAYSLDFLATGWAAVRDIANMAFIFILVYIAFIIILEAESANTMKMLAGVVVMALLINFSFFITRVVIDAGNLFAVQFYNSIQAPTLAGVASGAGISVSSTAATAVNALTPGSRDTKDLTAGIMQVVQVQNLLGSTSFNSAFTTFTNSHSFLINLIVQCTVYIVVGILFAMLAFVFFSVGVKFVIRMVVLWFVIIAAPLAFTAYAMTGVPAVKRISDEWMKTLINFSLYPGVFLFIYLIINYIANALGAGGGLVPSIFNDLNSSTTGSGVSGVMFTLGSAIGNIAIRIGLVIAMLYYGMKLSDGIVTGGGTLAAQATGAISGKVGAVADRARSGIVAMPSRVGAATGRRTVGWAGSKLGSTLEGTRWDNRKSWLPFGGGFNTRKRLSALGEKKFGGQSYKDVQDHHKAEHADMDAGNRKIDNKEDFKLLAALATKEKGGAVLSADEKKEKDRIVERIKDLSKSELESMNKDDVRAVMKHITEPMMKKIEESDKYNDAEKEAMRKTWHEESDASPVRQTQKWVKELNTMNLNIPALTAELAKSNFDKEASTKSLLAIRKALGQIQNDKNDVRSKIQTLDRDKKEAEKTLLRPGASPAEIVAAQQTIADHQNLRDTERARLEALDDRSGEIEDGRDVAKKADEARGKAPGGVVLVR